LKTGVEYLGGRRVGNGHQRNGPFACGRTANAVEQRAVFGVQITLDRLAFSVSQSAIEQEQLGQFAGEEPLHVRTVGRVRVAPGTEGDRKSTRLNSSHGYISYA